MVSGMCKGMSMGMCMGMGMVMAIGRDRYVILCTHMGSLVPGVIVLPISAVGKKG